MWCGSCPGAYDEAQLVATAAVTGHANRVLAEIERMTNDMHAADALLLASEKVMQESKDLMQEAEETVAEMQAIVDENMPRQGGFVGKETGDAEFLALQAELLEEQNEQLKKAAIESNPGRLTASGGVFDGPSGREKWYNAPMETVISIMRQMGYSEEEYTFWIRDDGVKMFGDFVMVAADTNERPKGTVLETSLGRAMVVDHCVAAETETGLIDIAVWWGE